MSGTKRVGDLEISQDLEHQRKSWAIQRTGWAVMGLLILAAILGLFGTGLMSRTVSGGQDAPLRAEYDRFWRMMHPLTLRLHLAPEATRTGEARVWISRSYLDIMSVEQVTPQAESVLAGSDRLTYVFALSDTNRPVTITFGLEAQTPGSASGQVGLENGDAVNIKQFIYP